MYKKMNVSDWKYVCGMYTQDRHAPSPLPEGGTSYGFVDIPVCQGRHTVNPQAISVIALHLCEVARSDP